MHRIHSDREEMRRAAPMESFDDPAPGETPQLPGGPRRPRGSGVGARALLASTLLVAILLPSCGTRHTALRHISSAAEQPLHYREVATSNSMASSIPEVFDTGPAIKKEMLKLIASARDYILVDSFLLAVDAATSDVMDSLRRKHRAGVRVYVLADSSSRHMPGGKKAFRFLDEAGIPRAEYNPMRIYKIVVAPIMMKRDHRKFWIVDGKTLFLGGANLFSTSLNPPEKNGNRDFMVSVESAEAIKHMIESFVVTWNHCSRHKLKKGSFRVRARKHVETQLWLSDQNKHAGHRDMVAKMFEGLFAVAQDEIWLVQPYTFVTSDMLKQLRDLDALDVTVNVMLSGKVQSPRFNYASHYGIEDLLKAGAKVWVYRPEHGPLHAKAIVVDGRWASIGSANFNSRSYHFSKEANLVFGDPKSVKKVMRTLEELKKGCRPVGLAEAKQYRGANYYFAWLMMQVFG